MWRIACLFCAAALLAGCGRDAPGDETVAHAAAASLDRTSARATLTGTVVVAGHRGTVRGRGIVSFTPPGQRFLTAVKTAQRTDTTEDILVGGVWYVRPPTVHGPGKRWIRIHDAPVAEADPGQDLQLLTGAHNVKRVGRDTIDGHPTTHYTASFDNEAADELTFKGRKQRVRRVDGKYLPVDVWIDANHLVRRERIRFVSAHGRPQDDLTTDFFDYGASTKTLVAPKIP